MAFSAGNDSGGPMATINVTPLVDVMLVLLIIFMITAPLMTHKVEIKLPEANLAKPEEAPKTPPITLAIQENGSIYWTSATGAFEVHGAIRDKWAELGWEAGALGYPVSNETITPDGIGRFSVFQRGSIYWTAQTGAHEVRGAIRDKYAETGWESGALGYPVSDEYAVPGGRRSDFQRGIITWDSATSTSTVTLH